MRFLKDLFTIFYPDLCINCTQNLLQSETILCNYCKNDTPIIQLNNQITNLFYGKIELENIVSFLYYRKNNITQKLIHKLKYKGREDIGRFLGHWFVKESKSIAFFSDIEYIIPVPLHKSKLKARGYNQVTAFGISLSEAFNIEYCENKLVRVLNSKTQTLKKHFERFNYSDSKFKLVDNSFFENKHILLIDDVITTGATIEACCNELLKTKNIKISVASIALTKDN